MFTSATLKLTGIYLVIIMVISLFFSLNIYRAANSEITNTMMGQIALLDNTPRFRGIMHDPQTIKMREQQLSEARAHIVFNLINTNIVILVIGGLASYLLARKTLQPIEEAHDAQSRFSADASHELRTPIAAMQTEIEVALRDPKLSRAQALDLLKSNLEELSKLTALSDGLLKLARIDGELPLESVQTDQILARALSQVAAVAKHKGVELTNTSKRSHVVTGNLVSLVELVVILLDNAIKYSPPGGKVFIHAGTNVRKVVISVRDEGVGIAEADRAHIFERFYRSDRSRSKNDIDGHGLGLSIAQKIAKLHKAQLQVKSTVNKGSTFMIIFG